MKSFRDRLKACVPTEAEFQAGISQLEFLSTNTKQKALVQYLLQRIDEHLRSGAPVDYSKMTIEHVSPENPPEGTPVEPGVGRLGNLLLLDHQTNDNVANKPFLTKQKGYLKAGVPLDDTLRLATK